jgi:hypothetical protein
LFLLVNSLYVAKSYISSHPLLFLCTNSPFSIWRVIFAGAGVYTKILLPLIPHSVIQCFLTWGYELVSHTHIRNRNVSLYLFQWLLTSLVYRLCCLERRRGETNTLASSSRVT